MPVLEAHPTVLAVRRAQQAQTPTLANLDAVTLRQWCLDAGADDVGFVELTRPELADQRADILSIFPRAKTAISFACRMNRENIRTPARSVSNLEFHHTHDHVDEVARQIVRHMEQRGIRAMNGGAMGFPMEMDRFPGKTWVVSHKPVAVAAGLGHLGIHRNVIHPRFGNFILLGTVLTEAEITQTSQPIDYNPCLECKLCVAACPTGAIGADGHFNFSACYSHNYREFMGGFSSWVETIADSPNAIAYREKVSDAESASMWQSLSFGANYKAAYCLSVCPAGEDVITPFLTERKQFLNEVVRPLQEKKETIYVVPGSDAEGVVARRFPNKTTKRISNGVRPQSIASFLFGLKLTFQRDQSAGLDATYHFIFTGKESKEATVEIRNKTVTVSDGLQGKADMRITADSGTWLRFLAKEANLLWALLCGKIRLSGSPRLLLAFGRCFPA